MTHRDGLATSVILILMWMMPSLAWSRNKADTLTMRRMFAYASTVDTAHCAHHARVYTKFRFHIDRKNALLMTVPNLYMVARGKQREYIAESLDEVDFRSMTDRSAQPISNKGTMPRNRRVFTSMLNYLTPDLYGSTLVKNNLLSPFHRHNRHFYRYRVNRLPDGTAIVSFRPKRRNTQTVNGFVTVDYSTGRIIRGEIKGEYDMVKFQLNVEMGDSGVYSLLPRNCEVLTTFKFLGNKVRCRIRAVYTPLSTPCSPTLDKLPMDSLRAEPLDSIDRSIYAQYEGMQTAGASPGKHRTKTKAILWDMIGKNLIDRIKSNFGKNNQGYFRISPIMNPLYLGYSKRRGFTYKFDVRGSYLFSANNALSLRFKGGYSFKQKQFYFSLPLRWNYDVRHNGYVEAEVGNGNRITNSKVLEQVKAERTDTIDWDALHLDYFKDMHWRMLNCIDITRRFGLKTGFTYYRRTPVNKQSFITAGKPLRYNSFAPFVELQIRPWYYTGPIFTIDYEQGISGVMQSDSRYTRWEFDGSYTHRMKCMRSLSLRLGGGFYSSKGTNQYFLDYSNFRDNNIPGGWNDDWSGGFELLNSNWYNASDYYVRANMTYESPLMLLSWLPWVGRIVEKERIYCSSLIVRHLHPYMEYGYGFTNRLFSMGIFAAMRNTQFDGMGFKFGFELFSRWR